MTLNNKNFGLLGVGNMGTSILEGLLSQGLVNAGRVVVYDKMADKAAEFSKAHGVHLAVSSEAAAEKSDILLLAVKPQDFDAAIETCRAKLKPEQIVISILAGTPFSKLRNVLGGRVRIVRAMPNLGARVGESLTALTGENEEALVLAEAVFSGCGKTIRLSEEHFDLFTALVGSGPAYFYLLMETIEQKALEAGFAPEAARLAGIQTAVGAALSAQSAGSVSPAELRQRVTSKGGTTEAALEILEKGNIRKLFSAAYDAAAQRGRELSQG